MPLTPRTVLLTIGVTAFILSVVFDKRKISLRKTIPQIHNQITRATPVVRFFEIVTVVSFVTLLVLFFV